MCLQDGVFIINTARGAICDTDAIAKALNSGKIRAYGGDVWPQQPAPKDMPWRSMHYKGDEKNGGNGMVPHYSGTTLDAQIRYANGVKSILDKFFKGEKQNPTDVIVEDGDYASKAYGQREKKTTNVQASNPPKDPKVSGGQ